MNNVSLQYIGVYFLSLIFNSVLIVNFVVHTVRINITSLSLYNMYVYLTVLNLLSYLC